MKIISVIPDVFQEYISEVSLGLFCFGCSMKCRFCHSLDKVLDPEAVIGDAKELFLKHVTPLHTAVVISGGEPTLWKDSLIELATIIKGAGLKVKVFSNALQFDVIYTLNKMKLVDEYSFDVKAAYNVAEVIGIPISDEDYLTSLFTVFKNCKENGVPFELRHTMAPGIDTNAVRVLLEGADKEGIPVHFQKYVEYL